MPSGCRSFRFLEANAIDPDEQFDDPVNRVNLSIFKTAKLIGLHYYRQRCTKKGSVIKPISSILPASRGPIPGSLWGFSITPWQGSGLTHCRASEAKHIFFSCFFRIPTAFR